MSLFAYQAGEFWNGSGNRSHGSCFYHHSTALQSQEDYMCENLKNNHIHPIIYTSHCNKNITLYSILLLHQQSAPKHKLLTLRYIASQKENTSGLWELSEPTCLETSWMCVVSAQTYIFYALSFIASYSSCCSISCYLLRCCWACERPQ